MRTRKICWHFCRPRTWDVSRQHSSGNSSNDTKRTVIVTRRFGFSILAMETKSRRIRCIVNPDLIKRVHDFSPNNENNAQSKTYATSLMLSRETFLFQRRNSIRLKLSLLDRHRNNNDTRTRCTWTGLKNSLNKN